MYHYAQLNFLFLVKIGFCHVGQAVLELLSASDPPTSASQSARITGVSHHAKFIFFFNQPNLLKLYICLQLEKKLLW